MNKIRIHYKDEDLKHFILGLLSCSESWIYQSKNSFLELKLKIKDKEKLQQEVFDWLKRRVE